MATLISLKQQMLAKWESGLPPKMLPATAIQKDRMDSIVTAVLTAGDITVSAATVNGGIIVGGASAPAGPVAGALMNTVPGGLLAPTRWEAKNVFIPPTTVVTSPGGKSFPALYTDWLRTLQETVSDAVASFWDAWYPTWVCANVIALGGVAAYTPPVPPSPGTPGPWTLGTITPFTLVGAQGTNPSPALDLLKTQLTTKAKATSVVVQNGEESMLIPPTNGDLVLGVIESFCDAFVDTFNTWSSTALVTDVTGVGASGMAAPPAGMITTGTISGLKII